VILASQGVPYLARLALMRTLKMRCDERPTVQALAEHIGVSRSHLSRTLAGCGVDIRHFRDQWTTVLAVVMHSYDDLPWDKVARRLGYASLSGLSDLLYRSSGVRLRHPTAGDPTLWLQWFGRRVVQRVLDVGSESHAPRISLQSSE